MSSTRIRTLVLLLLVAPGCTALSTHQTPDVIPVGQSRLQMQTGIGYVEGAPQYAGIPWGVGYRTAVAPRHEIGLRFGSPGGIFGDWKVQFHDGDVFDMATGFTLGSTAVEDAIVIGGLPIYAGWKVRNDLTFYLALRGGVFIENDANVEQSIYPGGGGSLGLQFGNERAGVFVELSGAGTYGRTLDFEPDEDLFGVYFSVAPYVTFRPFDPFE